MSSPTILLAAINARYIHTNLAVRSLKANAGEYERYVEICEYTINHRREEILQGLYRMKPDVIGFSCYLWNIEYVVSVARDLKKILPEVRILLGGPEVSWQPERVLHECSFVDVIMVGEGERTFRDYLAWYVDGGELSAVAGLVYRKVDERGEEGGEEKLVRTGARDSLDMDELVFPYRSLEGMEHRILYYETMRGCPFSCSYCLSSIEREVRSKSLPKIFAELDFFLENRVPQVKFVDRTFNCNHHRACEIWKYIGAHDNGITNFHFEIGGDLLQEEDLALFESFRPGLVQFEIGVQSVNPDTIRAIRRTMDLPKLRENVRRVHELRNIHQHLDLIAGLPWEDRESFARSFNEVYAMKPDQLQLGFLKVLEGSLMAETARDYDILYGSAPPYEVYRTRWLSYDDILELKQVEEMVEKYYNSLQFCATMSYLLPCFDTAYDMYRELGCYYQERNLFSCRHNRLRRYEILWEFSETIPALQGERQREELREVMTFDLFHRDYVKSPPAFVGRRSEEMRRDIRSFLERVAEGGEEGLEEYAGYTGRQLFHLLYVDLFTIDMDILIEKGRVEKTQPYYLIFDYRRRNMLDHSAGTLRRSNL